MNATKLYNSLVKLTNWTKAGLAKKADATAITQALSTKADATATANALAGKQPNYLYGTADPAANVGNNGDVYFVIDA